MPKAAAQPFVTSQRPSGVPSRAATQDRATIWTWQSTPNPTNEAGWTTTRATRPGCDAPNEQNKLGSYYCWNRTYEPSTGRWITPDPAQSPWSNLWDYCGGQPVSSTDGNGLEVTYHGDKDPLTGETMGPQGVDMGHTYAYMASLKCGVFLFKYRFVLDNNIYDNQGWRHDGLETRTYFISNRNCCCDSLQMVQFTRERQWNVKTNRVTTNGVGSATSQSPDGWQVDTQNPKQPQLPKSRNIAVPGGPVKAKIGDDESAGIGLLGDKSGIQTNEQHRNHESGHSHYFKDFVNCVYCDNGTFMGCFSYSYVVIPGSRVTFLHGSVKATDNPDFMNQHPARKAWNESKPAQEIPEVK